VYKEFTEQKLFNHGGLFSTDSIPGYSYISFDSLNNGPEMHGSGFYKGKAKDMNTLFSGTVPFHDTSTVRIISFWMNNAKGDLYPRSIVKTSETDNNGKIVKNDSRPVSKQFVNFYNNRVLVEFAYQMANPDNTITISLQNKALGKKVLEADDFLIRTPSTQVYQHNKDFIIKNNRIFARCP
jgi:hypothetical protein